MDVETQHGDPLKTPKPHDFLWFPEGNVILATDTYFFKVHKSLLSVHSSVFRDMFELPNIGGFFVTAGPNVDGIASEMYEGLPLVTLIGDKGEGVVHLLRAIYERHYYHRDDDNTPVEVVTALLVLSTKYDFKDIRKDVTIQISKHFPMTLQDFDPVNDDNLPLFGGKREDCMFPLLLAAFTAGVDVLLPTLYFTCSYNSMRRIWDQSRSMPPECLFTLLEGRDSSEFKLNQLISELPESLWEAGACIGCEREEPCLPSAHYKNLGDLIGQSFDYTIGFKVVENHLSSICASCSSIVAKGIDMKREEVWDDIPSCFGFPGWDVLQAKMR